MPSVAGQIRIDLIANTARWTAGLREGGASLGMFQDQIARVKAGVDRGFNSEKAWGERVTRSVGSWKSAMESIRGEVLSGREGTHLRDTRLRWNALVRSNTMPVDRGLEGQIRRTSMLQDVLWGAGPRAAIARNAAETAAAVAAGGRKIAGSLRGSLAEMGMAMGYAGPGLGGVFGGIGRFLWAHPLLVGGGLLAGKMVHDTVKREDFAVEVGRSSLQLGQSTRDTDRLLRMGLDVGMLSRFQRALSERTPEQMGAFERLGLSPDRLEGGSLLAAMGEVAGAMDRLKNPADAAASMMDLFGKSGAEMIPVLSQFRERLQEIAEVPLTPVDVAEAKASKAARESAGSAWGAALTPVLGWLGRRTEELTLGVQGVNAPFYPGGLDAFRGRAEAIARRRWRENQESDPVVAERRERDRLERVGRMRQTQADLRDQERAAKAQADIASLLGEAGSSREDPARRRFVAKLDELGIRDRAPGTPEFNRQNVTPRVRTLFAADFARTNLLEAYDDAARREKEREKDLQAAERVRSQLKTARKPEDVFREEMAEATNLFLHARLDIGELAAYRVGLLRDYYREAAGLDDKQLRKSLQRPREEYLERKAWLGRMARDKLLSPEQESRLGDDARRGYLEKLGIKDALGDYGRSFRDLSAALDAGDITPEQFGRRRRSLRREALAGMDLPQSPGLIGAAEYGSREAYAILANAMSGTGADALARESLRKLDAIERNTRPGQAPAPQLFDMN